MTPYRLPIVLLLAGLSLLAAACSAAVAGPSTATPPVPEGSALARLVEIIDAINRDDTATAYAGLAPEVQAQITQEQFAGLFRSVEEGTGGDLVITVEQVHSEEEAGDLAEIELTLRIRAGTAVDFTLRQVAILERIDGEWRLADHFLQTALTALGVTQPGRLERAFDANGCLVGDVLAGVYAPSRLRVLDPCVTTSGVVRDLTHETDGDVTFNLALPPEDERLLNDENRARKNGMLHIEIIPGDQERVATPADGDRVRVTGAWVLDAGHGWNEIHPAWSVEPIAPTTAPELPSTGFGPDSY